jgi:hypothetical protein
MNAEKRPVCAIALVTIGEGLLLSMTQSLKLPVSNPLLWINEVAQSGGVGVGVGEAVWHVRS